MISNNSEDLFEKLRNFEEALNAGPESTIHSFIAKHQWILGRYLMCEFLLNKFRLGDEYETDFVALGNDYSSWDLRPSVTFIEIERAEERLFTKSGDPSSFLTHALRQVQDWKAWVGENSEYFGKRLQRTELASSTVRDFPGDRGEVLKTSFLRHGFCAKYLVLAGRIGSLSMSDRIRLMQMNEDLKEIRILTYDKILEYFLDWEHRREK